MKNTLIIPEKLEYEDEKTLYLYCLLQKISNGVYIHEMIFDKEIVSYYLGKGRHEKEWQKDSLDKLVKLGYISYDGYKYYKISTDQFYEKQNHFVIMNMEEFDSLVNHKKEFKHLCHIVSTFSNITHVSNVSIQYLVDREKISHNTVIAYNKFLEENKYLYISHSTYDEEVLAANFYCRPEDRNNIFNPFENDGENKGNIRRSVAQRYVNFIKKNGEGYTKQEISDLYHDVCDYNEDPGTSNKKDPAPILRILAKN